MLNPIVHNPEFIKDAWNWKSGAFLKEKYNLPAVARTCGGYAIDARRTYPKGFVNDGKYLVELPEEPIKELGWNEEEELESRELVTRIFDKDPHTRFVFPESRQPIVTDQVLKLDGNYGLISDLHIPFHDNRVLEDFCNRCYDNHVSKFVVIGDTFDGNTFHPTRGGKQDHDRRYQDDVELTKVIFRQLLKCFDSGVVLQGNHDSWFIKHMRNQFDASWMMEHLFHEFGSRITHSNFEQCTVISDKKQFLLTHGANYSGTNILSVAQKLSAKYEMGVCMGHQHVSTEGWSYSGKYQCVCLGGALDTRRLMYVHNSPTVNAQMTNGFAILKDGWIKSYSTGVSK